MAAAAVILAGTFASLMISDVSSFIQIGASPPSPPASVIASGDPVGHAAPVGGRAAGPASAQPAEGVAS